MLRNVVQITSVEKKTLIITVQRHYEEVAVRSSCDPDGFVSTSFSPSAARSCVIFTWRERKSMKLFCWSGHPVHLHNSLYESDCFQRHIGREWTHHPGMNRYSEKCIVAIISDVISITARLWCSSWNGPAGAAFHRGCVHLCEVIAIEEVFGYFWAVTFFSCV